MHAPMWAVVLLIVVQVGVVVWVLRYDSQRQRVARGAAAREKAIERAIRRRWTGCDDE